MPSLLDAALAYAAKGWPVFPCRANKKPYTDNGVIDATTNKKQIKEWWTEYPNANIGCALDRAGMLVLDLDPGHDLRELEKNVGKLRETALRQRTPRGGEHWFYDIDDDEVIPPSVSSLAKHVDVRSFNSYVLLAPSRTKDGEYTWESEGKAAFRTDGIADKAKESARKKSADHDTWIIEPDLDENVEKAVEWLRKDASIAIEGVNGDHMAYATAAMMKSFGISPELALDLIWEHWNPRCDPPWSGDEIDHLRAKVENGYSYNTSPPGNMTKAYHAAKIAERFQPVAKVTSRDGTESIEIKSGRFTFYDRAGIRNIEPPEWLIKDTIPQKCYGLIVGTPGTFKSFIALDMALSIATGAKEYFGPEDEWYGMWPDVIKSGPVVYCAGEGQAAMNTRIEAWEKKHLDGESADNLILATPCPYPTDEEFEAFVNGIHLRLKENNLGNPLMIVIDTVSKSMQGLNENTQEDASLFTKLVQSFQHEFDCTILGVMHAGWGKSDRVRGSSVFHADVDFEYVIERDDKEFFAAIKNTKQKDAPEWEQPKIAQLIESGKSLTVTQPTERQAKTRQAQVSSNKSGPKSDAENTLINNLIREEAFQVLKDNPGTQFSLNTLSQDIAANPDSDIDLSQNRIYKRIKDAVTADKNHPIVRCYKRQGNRTFWVYHKKAE